MASCQSPTHLATQNTQESANNVRTSAGNTRKSVERQSFWNLPVSLEQIADWAAGLLRGAHEKLVRNSAQHGSFDDRPQAKKV